MDCEHGWGVCNVCVSDDPHAGDCEFLDGGATCQNFFDCCDCGGEECGCAYCWTCNACEACRGAL